MRVLIFGTGKYWQIYKSSLNECEIVGFLDNDKNKIGEYEGKSVYSPEHIPNELLYDYIFLLSRYDCAMRKQLHEVGIEDSKIFSYYQLGAVLQSKLNREELQTIHEWKNDERRILIAAYSMGQGGAENACYYLALTLQKMGYNVLVTCHKSGNLTQLYKKKGISCVCNQAMNCASDIFEELVKNSKFVFVNSIFQYYLIYHFQGVSTKIFWWLHDHSETYDFCDIELIRKINVKGNIQILYVSNLAKGVWEQYIGCRTMHPLRLGIEDRGVFAPAVKFQRVKPVIAVVAGLSYNKGQDILIKSLSFIEHPVDIKLIGNTGHTEYCRQVQRLSEQYDNIYFTGQRSNEDVLKMYQQGEIDILVCPSRFETLSISTIEAMMFARPVIVSDATGIADYIEDGKSGFIFESENEQSLANKINTALAMKEKLQKVGEEARKVYEKKFSLQILEEQVLSLIENI